MKNANDINSENDVAFEPIKGTDAPANDADTLDDSVIVEENALDTVKSLKEKLKKSQAEAKEYLDGWQRSKAEFINIRKRDEEDKKQFIRFANEGLISDLIPVLESFDLAMSNKEAWEKADKNWRMGVEYIYSQLKKTLSENGLEEVNPIGEKFDPTRDEAASYEPVTDAGQDHVIIQVIQKGYSLNKKALRPPKVSVGEFKA